MNRIDWFLKQQDKNRFWWFRDHKYLPDLYHNLTDEEFSLLQNWFEATEEAGMVGEVNIPAMSVMTSFINSSEIDLILQLGHFAGYSCLFFGWALKRIGGGRLVSVDINQRATNFTQSWLEIAGLSHIVTLITGDSTNQMVWPEIVRTLVKKPKMIFIDSSHEYENTLIELQAYYQLLEPGGLMFLHDVSNFASRYDRTGKGGPGRALAEWRTKETGSAETAMINGSIYGTPSEKPLVIGDGCGLGIVHKPIMRM